MLLSRDATHSTVLAVVRCQSVRPSVTLVYCVEPAKDVIKLFLGLKPVVLGTAHPEANYAERPSRLNVVRLSTFRGCRKALKLSIQSAAVN